jgi:acyl carrier protein
MTTAARIRDLVLRSTQWTGSPDELTDELSLIEGQVIDSFDLLTLISALEHEFGLDIPDEDLLFDNFASVGQIAAYVNSRRAARPPS